MGPVLDQENLRNQLDEETAKRLARALGWFSIGLGVAQVAAPRSVSRLIGVNGNRPAHTIVRAVGLREIVNGVGLLARRRPADWLWVRVAGDAMDLLLLKAALTKARTKRRRVTAAMAAVAGVTVPDVLGSTRLSHGNDSVPAEHALHVKAAVTVRRPRQETYDFWHDFENFPRFMIHLESVEALGDRRSRWTARSPGGRTVEWIAETTDDQRGELIAWRSLEGSDIDNEGTVRFRDAPGGRGTEVHLDMRYEAPLGTLGALIAKLAGKDPEQQVKDELRRFKQVVEAGEVVVSEGSPEGIHAARQLRQRPARPPASAGGGRSR